MNTQLTPLHRSALDKTGFETPASIEQSDLELLLEQHSGNANFEHALRGVKNGSELLSTLSAYIYFNSVFACGVVNLAGEIGSRQNLFRDRREPVEIAADRSIEVAARVFFAAIDEFGVSGNSVTRSTHRTLAQATLKAIGNYLGYEGETLNEITAPGESALSAVERVRDGYAMNQKVDDEKLFRALGFHIGSEILADKEFNLLEHYLSENYFDLVEHLKHSNVTINTVEVPPYRWIQIHTFVEAEHFNSALMGANLALRYYAGPESGDTVREWILQGFMEFATMQSEFMKSLTKLPE